VSQQPPQFSPDGLYWWDGTKWVPRPGVPAVAPQPQPPPPPLAYTPPPPPPPPSFSGYSGIPSYLKPSPGLRIVLLVALALDVGLTGLLMLTFLIAFAQPEGTAVETILAFAFAALFGMAVAALIGVAIRASWSRWLALASGILISWTVAGLLLGVPIVVCAARAPDLGPRKA
jgi:hypothetical protein